MRTLLAFSTALLLGRAEAQRTHAAERTVVRLAVASYTSAPAAVAIRALGMGMRVDSIWISMKNLGFREASNDVKRAYADGPVTGEFVSGEMSGLSDGRTIETGRYGGFEFQFHRSKGSVRGAPLDLRGASVLVQGYRPDGVRFVVRAQIDSHLALRAHTGHGFTLAKGVNQLFLAVDVARWMAGLNLATAEVAREGPKDVIRIDEKSNAQLLKVFQMNLSPGLGLFRDVDQNGAFDPNDRGKQGKLASGVIRKSPWSKL